MAMADRKASVTWTGDLAKGNGSIRFDSSGIGEYPVTWASRTERADGKTSPEELIAAAHGACFSMGLSHGLSQAGHVPERLHVEAVCTLDRVDGRPRITTMRFTVRGRVPGIDQAAFEAAAEAAKDGCPVSNALSGNVTIYVDARLE